MNLKYFKKRIEAKGKDAKQRPVIIVAFGDSVTMGVMRINDNDYDAVYHARFKKMLEAEYPQSVFSVINSGVNRDDVKGGLKRLGRDVISYNPDLVIIGFALNDSCAGIEKVDEYGRTLESIIRRIQKQTRANIIMLTPNFMNMGNNKNIEVLHRKLNLHKLFSKIQRGGVLKAYSDKIRQLAEKYNLHVADTYAAWEELSDVGVNTDSLLINGLNHPAPELHAIPAELLMNCIIPDCKASAIKRIINEYREKHIACSVEKH